MIRAIGLDADDTLWENETFFRLTEGEFCAMLSDHAEPDHIASRLIDIERANLERYGYGIKGFMLSMVETAIQLTDGAVDGRTIARILELGQDMLAHPVDLLPGVERALDDLSDRPLILITKGDLMDQERKVAASGLAERFAAVEILADKTPEAYARVLSAHDVDPRDFLMAGNSLKSDVIPVLELGGWGIHIPHGPTWVLEHAEEPDAPRFRKLAGIAELPALIRGIEQG
ncbi:HAD family hydrolase [Paracoccus sp. 1_MG-2023]|uniref:HAD family hydrolase n=1 Tax=unclassified Paracoccus (in: a-proteobacteria) TaxID=2688777 RepID=UPI001C0A2C6C|nr:MULTISPECIES: HAD family hydrolase [unclassified Paracoccus (in: a-proteobacteria)]MBU2956674.1 HAD family hydrolase [Paracoccus sp. C2R09]MDO6668779.1 HAD family hydrolase [Paracoccus sp. 1_MG-2023]